MWPWKGVPTACEKRVMLHGFSGVYSFSLVVDSLAPDYYYPHFFCLPLTRQKTVHHGHSSNRYLKSWEMCFNFIYSFISFYYTISFCHFNNHIIYSFIEHFIKRQMTVIDSALTLPVKCTECCCVEKCRSELLTYNLAYNEKCYIKMWTENWEISLTNGLNIWYWCHLTFQLLSTDHCLWISSGYTAGSIRSI